MYPSTQKVLDMLATMEELGIATLYAEGELFDSDSFSQNEKYSTHIDATEENLDTFHLPADHNP